MAQLKSTIVQGSLRVTDTTYTNELNLATATASRLLGTDANKKVISMDMTFTSPTAASTSHATAFIDTISQGANGQITATKANIPIASTSTTGIMKVGTGLGATNGVVNVSYGTTANTALQGNATLFTLNNSGKTASAAASFYAPTAGGTAGHILIGAGATTAPAWYGGTVMSGTAAASWKTAFNGTTDATATNAAAVTIAGGLGVAKKLRVGDTATVPDLTIGSTNEYGDAYTPIYWHGGVPTVVTLTQQCAFTINSGKSGVKLSHAAITANSYVTQIVVTSGEANLNSAISWTSAAGYIELTCSSTVSGDVTGYIMISRGGEITATATDIT